MDYLILFLGVILSSATAVLLKIYQNQFGVSKKFTFFFTGCMTLAIAIVMICFAKFTFNLSILGIIIAIIMGVLYSLNMPTYQKALSIGGIGRCSIFLFLGGLLLPFLYGAIWLNEQVTVYKIIGLVVVVAAVFVQLDLKSSSTGKSFFIYGILIFLMNGLFCVLLKVEAVLKSNTFETMCIAGASASIISFIMFFITKGEKSGVFFGVKPKLIALGTTVGYGAMNGFSNVINIYVASKLPATVQFPVNSAGVIVVTVLSGIVFFKEKLNLRSIFSIILSIIAIVLYTV